MLQILIFGVVVVLVYLLSNFLVIKAEAVAGVQLGYWRTVAFFVVFLSLLLIAMQLLPRLVPGMAPPG